MKSAAPSSSSVIDARRLEPRFRHAHIFSTFAALDVGSAIELVNDHDPQPLYAQFQSQWPDRFAWNYLEQGPSTWRVAITKVPAFDAHARGGCCGGCGGA
ncbi:DUF2249 domain-containing protein [Variovorax sp. Root434]|uniref:DUF2249 domain-containing protein n=1 Tax=Variovorax sp. Root434 TaxID=1736536 RepID=UPI0006F819C8|nr:DUF2249 domain-containing protein [Variovorax sp. Root434]KQX31927.1 aminotransferase [Variovorax sp. Root434]